MKIYDIDIVLCSTRSVEFVSTAIARFLGHRPGPKRIIVVLIEGHQGLSKLGHLFDRIQMVGAPCANLSMQRNIGLKLSDAAIVGFVDDDTVLMPNHLKRIWQTFRESSDLIGVGGKILNYGQAPHWLSMYRRLFFLSRPDASGAVTQLRSGFFVWPDPRQAPTQVNALWGCCMWWRRKKIQGVWFDEDLSAFEDVEFGLRARKRGSLVISETASIEHLHDPSGRRPVKQALRQVLEARRIARSNPECCFSSILWAWAGFGQLALAVASKLVRTPWLLAPEYREPNFEKVHADHN